jgi:hypothetical protein
MAARAAQGKSNQLPDDERRAEARYAPDPLVPVLFGHPGVEVPSAGHIVDISEGGVRIVAPPMARPGLHWGDPLRIIVSYSASSRDSHVEGLMLRAHVVRVVADQRAYTLQAQFDKAGSDGDWERLSNWIRGLATSD